MSPSRIVALATAIAANTKKVDDYLTSKGLPPPSFDADTPVKYDFPPDIAVAQLKVLEDTEDLQTLMLGPLGQLLSSASNKHSCYVALQAIVKFKMTECFSDGKESATYAEIAAKCGLEERMTRRLIRSAIAYGVFQELQPGIVTHSGASKLLATNPKLQSWVVSAADIMVPAESRVVDAMQKWPGSQEPNQCGFNLSNNTDKPIFEVMGQDPVMAQHFADAMSLFSSSPEFAPKHLIENYPWEELGDATIVDVGGSHGVFMSAIAEKFPRLHCIIQDRPEVIETAPTLGEGLAGRVSFQAHDFFTEQPVKNADVYFLRWILHDWPDKYAIRIIRALIPALRPGGKILISEAIMPEPGVISSFLEKGLRTMDLSILGFQNAGERSLDEWVALFQEANPGFNLTMAKQPLGSGHGFIEMTWKDK